MNKITRKLLMSVLSLAFAVVALGATTFAWFTIGETVVVGPMDTQVTVGKGIEVSLDDKYYFSTITPELINEYLDKKIKEELGVSWVDETFASSFKLWPNTSADGKTFQKQDSASAAVEAKLLNGVVSFPLYFRSGEETTLKLTGQNNSLNETAPDDASDDLYDLTTYVWSEKVHYALDQDVTYKPYTFTDTNPASVTKEAKVGTATTMLDFYAANAIRISFDAVSLSNETGDIDNKEYTYDGEKTVSIYAPEKLGTSMGIATASDEGFVPAYIKARGARSGIKNTVLPVFNSSIEGDLRGVNGAVVSVVENDTLFQEADNEHCPDLITLTKIAADGYYKGMINVHIWLEGWDPDCINPVMRSQIKIQLVFAKVEAI